MTHIPTVVEDREDKKDSSFVCFEQSSPGKVYHFYISKPIGSPKEYVEMIHKIKTASPNDACYLYLNTPGGQLDTGVQIMTAMRSSNARIITVLEGEVCSLGTLIFLCGEEFIVHEHSLLMIHNHSGGQWGKGHEYMARAEATVKWFETIAKDVYGDFLTTEEIQQMLDGRDFWFQAEEIKKRLSKMVRTMTKRIKEEQKKK